MKSGTDWQVIHARDIEGAPAAALAAMPMPRVVTMVLMLAIMGLIFARLRDPSTWRWFSRDDDDSLVVTHNESCC